MTKTRERMGEKNERWRETKRERGAKRESRGEKKIRRIGDKIERYEEADITGRLEARRSR